MNKPLGVCAWRARRFLRRAARLGRIASALLLVSLAAAQAQKPAPDLAESSLEALMNLEVTSVSKKQEKLSQTAAAIFVITQEDIRRSGATSIPEVLRIVPGLDVAHVDANKWAISSRGFNDRFANKMLVLIDGRSVYTPLFSGVYWDVQDMMLEDIERIEVIRGPGATLWGANAVNGVINVITKKAKDTQGGLVTAGAGNQERGFGAVRYGGKLNNRGYYRFFAKSFYKGEFADSHGRGNDDSWDILRGGLRTDWKLSANDSLTVQGDHYTGGANDRLPSLTSLSPPTFVVLDDRNRLVGGNVLGRWSHAFSARSDTALQVYYDRADRRYIQLAEVRHTFDIDFQHHIAVGSRHDIVWGLGYRFTTDQTSGTLDVSFSPNSQSGNLFNAFIQDEIVLFPNRLKLTLGATVEHNEYIGVEFMPDLRVLWTPHTHHAIWAAVSHAVRSPSRADVGIRTHFTALPGPRGATLVGLGLGNANFREEEMTAYEWGYRVKPTARLSADLVAFYNSYDGLRAVIPTVPSLETSPAPPHLVLPFIFQNALEGETHGLELAPTWSVTNRWRLSGGYAWLQAGLRNTAPGGDLRFAEPHLNSPQHQWNVRSYLSLPGNLEFDTSLYFVSRIPEKTVPGYTRFDTRLGWRPRESVEFSVVGQNLQNARHTEFGSTGQFVQASEVRRSVYGKVTWRF